MVIRHGPKRVTQLNSQIKRFLDHSGFELMARWVLGAVFVYASFHKILDPEHFAKIIYGYYLFPDSSINLIAIILPYIELFAGAALILGIYPRSAALIINVMLLAFIAAISINLIRGHEFDCGCFSFGVSARRFTMSSGTSIPGTLFFMYRAIPADFMGVMPAMI